MRQRAAAHQALREGTAAAHQTVDAVFARFDLNSRSSYARFLAAHAQALLPAEAALDAAGAQRITDDWPQRRRSALLRADLADLSAPTAPHQSPPSLAGDAQLAGTLYVIEGSRLGGRVLARRVAPDLPLRYLNTDQAIVGWATLLDRLDMVLNDPDRLHTAIASALDMFASFERAGRHWLQEH